MTESVADFKHRIAQLRRELETGKKFSIVGGPRAHASVVRKNNNNRKNEKNESNKNY
jgi:hypothetical protein